MARVYVRLPNGEVVYPKAKLCVMPYELDYPVREFRSMADVRTYYWGPPKPDEQGQSRIATFVTVGSLRGWNTCGDGPDCSHNNALANPPRLRYATGAERLVV